MTRERPFALDLLGPFRIIGPDGRRIEITSKKGIALVAMLAMASEGERTRSWLQDKLWGERQRAQAQGSLRRELTALRRCLNVLPTHLLICEHDRVRLDLGLIKVDARTAAAHADADRGSMLSGEFLEGFDIAGADGFEEWLREQRRALEVQRAGLPASPSGQPLRVISASATGVSDTERPDPAGAAAATSGGERPAAALSVPDLVADSGAPPSLAVLPFANLTGEPDNDYLAEGISEDLIDRLSRLRWLPVIARSSSFLFGAANTDPRAFGRSLGAKYLLEGRLRRVVDRFWLSISLSDTATGYTLSSQRIELSLPHSRDTLDQLVAELVTLLDARIDYAEQTRARNRRPDRPDVNDLIWRGRWHLNKLTREDADIARRLFDDALQLDPNSSEALIQATTCLNYAIWTQRGSANEISEMRRLAQRAIIADPDDGRGHMQAGIAEMWLRQPVRARALLQQAIALNPSLAMAHAQLGCCYNLAGEPERAIAPLKAALRLSPNDVHIFFTFGELAVAHGMLGQWHEAAEHADQSVVRRPGYWYAQVIKINALARTGNPAAAALTLGELMAAKPDFSEKFLTWLPFVDRTWVDGLIDGLRIASSNRISRSNDDAKVVLG
ncbi:tetratricopeptide repeat protein [Vineibacter terrae]|uniref:Tetratricopeptide repeat protein n=1 Tax=Vineibacter terrae TaxID=2586908 RepID=A0A5C8PVD8_9HYPH|nr:tetratricopeptide repeat protein [Vineibacter terrae]TXL82187.1 tetratricopeptide repeat protein [Vineibacter terrae]